MLLDADRPGPPRALSSFWISAAVHFTILIALCGPFVSPAIEHAGSADRAVAVFVAPSADAAPASAAPRETEGPPPVPEDLGIELPPGTSRVSLPEFTVDFEKVVRRAASLFPFLKAGVLDDVVPQERPGRDRALGNPLLRAAERGQETPLVMNDAEIQQVTDRAWSRTDRWRAFRRIAAYADEYSAQDGRLPDLFRAYVDQNLLQVFVDGPIRDPRLWAQLNVAADHGDFVSFIRDYAARHPGTRGRVELLFLLDKLTQASVQALVTLIDTNPTEQLQHTRAANANAYRAVMTIRQHYFAELDRLRLTSREAVIAHFDGCRLAILENILRTTPGGYRAADARYLIGEIRWGQGHRQEAARVWRAIREQDGDTYARPYSEIRQALEARGAEEARETIERILHRERTDWAIASSDRLRTFGYHVDTF